jgi:hypothetical protein
MTVTPKKKAGPSARTEAQLLTPEQIGDKRFYQAARAFGQGRNPDKNFERLKRLRKFVKDDYAAIAFRKYGVELPQIPLLSEITAPTVPIQTKDEGGTMAFTPPMINLY